MELLPPRIPGRRRRVGVSQRRLVRRLEAITLGDSARYRLAWLGAPSPQASTYLQRWGMPGPRIVDRRRRRGVTIVIEKPLRRKRRHSEEFKDELVRACSEPGISSPAPSPACG